MRPSTRILAPSRPLKLAIIGSGPSAFYAAARVLSSFPHSAPSGPASGNASASSSQGRGRDRDQEVEVHMFEQLPSPHGLVRYGVAPDHPEVKNVQNRFDEVAQDPRFRFFGNVVITASPTVHYPPGVYPYTEALHIPLSTLLPHYTALLLSYGASSAKPLRIPGERDISNVWSSLEFVNWYNGHPAAHWSPPPLPSTTGSHASSSTSANMIRPSPSTLLSRGTARHATLIGAGNVSLDILRLLLKSPTEASLSKTDTPEPVLSALAASKIEHVDIVARRGPGQLAFTNKEAREVMNLEGVAFHGVDKKLIDEAREEIERREREVKEAVAKSSAAAGEDSARTTAGGTSVNEARARKRLLGLLEKGSKAKEDDAQRSWALKFFRSPAALLGEEAVGTEKGPHSGLEQDGGLPPVKGVLWNHTTLRPATTSTTPGRPASPSSLSASVAAPAGEKSRTETDMVVSSVGYRSEALGGHGDDIDVSGVDGRKFIFPFDRELGVVRNVGGRVVDAEGMQLPNVYASGWVSRGPVGVIATTMYDAYTVADLIVADHFASASSPASSPPTATAVPLLGTGPERSPVPGIPRELTDSTKRIVSYEDWMRIDEEEKRRGKELGKQREKFLSVPEMLKVLD